MLLFTLLMRYSLTELFKICNIAKPSRDLIMLLLKHIFSNKKSKKKNIFVNSMLNDNRPSFN